MTSTKYVICWLASAFGYSRKNHRMGDAATEMHLLKEAEAHLGKAIWKNVESIEELSMEYWGIRKIMSERERVAGELNACQEDLATAHQERADLLSGSNESFQDLADEGRKVMVQLEELARERDEIVAKARDVRRNYDGIKMKHEVLEKEGGRSVDEVGKTTSRVDDLKKEFANLKHLRQEIAEKISSGNQKFDEIEAQIDERKKERRTKASEAFQYIGDANQKISNLSAELGVFDTQLRQLYCEIGRYVSRNALSNPACQKACKERRGLVEVMRALRKSVHYNHKLAELS